MSKIFEKIKNNSIIQSKVYKATTLGTTLSIALINSAHAEAVAPSLDGVVTSMTDTFATVSSLCVNAVAGIAPVAVTIFGLMFVWKKGIKFFKSLTQG